MISDVGVVWQRSSIEGSRTASIHLVVRTRRWSVTQPLGAQPQPMRYRPLIQACGRPVSLLSIIAALRTSHSHSIFAYLSTEYLVYYSRFSAINLGSKVFFANRISNGMFIQSLPLGKFSSQEQTDGRPSGSLTTRNGTGPRGVNNATARNGSLYPLQQDPPVHAH